MTGGLVLALLALGQSGPAGASGPPTYDVETLPVPAGETGASAVGPISCPAVGTCLALGGAPGGTTTETYANGTWTANLIGAPGTLPGLDALWCNTLTRCVAVGQEQVGDSERTRPMIATMFGGSWNVVTPPIPKSEVNGGLNAISCYSATSCAAAGYFVDAGGTFHPLFEVLSKGVWKHETSATPTGATFVNVEGVQCFSSTSCVAVGSFGGDVGPLTALAEQFSGRSWTPSPISEGTDQYVRSLSCVSSTQCLAVGYDQSGDGVVDALNGSAWTSGTLPGMNDGGTGNGMFGVSCAKSIRSCTAIGSWRPPAPNSAEPLVLIETESHGVWTPTEIPGVEGLDADGAIACPKATACVGVATSQGYAEGYPAQAFVETATD